MTDTRYRIGTAAELVGLSTHAIRVWERRYGALVPARTPGGARLYSDADVERLRLLKRAVDHGHAIGQVAQLGRDDLERLALPGDGAASASANGFEQELVEAARALDMPRAEQALTRAAAALSPRALVTEVLSPALRHIGDEWASGKLCVASEHAASNLVRERAAGMLRAFAAAGAPETVLVTTPAGELHELGALLAAVIAALHGYRISYLGPNLPAAEIARAARGCNAAIVALSVVALDASAAVREVEALAAELPQGVRLVIGGGRAAKLAAKAAPGVVALGTLMDFGDWLQKRRVDLQPR